MAELHIKVSEVSYEYREVTVPRDEAAIEKRRRWYAARGWEFLGALVVVVGKPEAYLKFRRVSVGEISVSDTDGAQGDDGKPIVQDLEIPVTNLNTPVYWREYNAYRAQAWDSKMAALSFESWLEQQLADTQKRLAWYEQQLGERNVELEDANERAAKAEAQLRMADSDADNAKDMYRLEHENAMLMYRTLAKHAPDALKEVRDKLNHAGAEGDKVMSTMQRRIEALTRAVWTLQGHFVAISDYALNPKSGTVNAGGMDVRERLDRAGGQAEAALLTIADTLGLADATPEPDSAERRK